MRHTGRADIPAAPKGAAFSCAELEAFEAVTVAARLACLKLKLMAWIDFNDDDSVASALVSIGEKPSDHMHEWEALVRCARVLRDGPNSA